MNYLPDRSALVVFTYRLRSRMHASKRWSQHTHSRTAALAKTPALMPLARNLRTTRLVLEVMVRASAATATASSGEEATGLSQLLAKEEGGLAALAVEVLHALART